MIIIADAGSTKTDWRLIDGDQITQFQTAGFNPHSHEGSALSATIPEAFRNHRLEVERLYYYGAGLFDEALCHEVSQNLQKVFVDSHIEAGSDLLGAARALFGTDSGVACVLGTGSAVCFYNGTCITQRVPSLGFLLGDEGSGYYFGRELLGRYLRKQLPGPLQKDFESNYGVLDESEVLHRVYGQTKANGWVAAFAAFVLERQQDPYIYPLLEKGVAHFFEHYFQDLETLKDHPIRFTGTVAHLLSSFLYKFAREHQLHIDRIAQAPIAGLTLYHQQHG